MAQTLFAEREAPAPGELLREAKWIAQRLTEDSLIVLPETEEAQETRLAEITECVKAVLERVRLGESTKLDNVDESEEVTSPAAGCSCLPGDCHSYRSSRCHEP